MTERAPRRIVIHAGFHKTGTTSLQTTFDLNRALIEPHVELYLRNDFRTRLLAKPVRHFAAHRNKAAKSAILEEATAFFAGLDPLDPRPIFVSHENLSGTFIGKDRVASYAAAPIAIAIFQEAWRAVNGTEAGFEVLYSTRQNGWIASCHWQRVRHDRETRDLAAYQEIYAKSAALDTVVEDIRNRLAPSPVHSFAVEEVSHPAKAALDVLGLGARWHNFQIPENQNITQGEDLRAQLLELNRSPLQGAEFHQERRRILNRARA